MTWRPRMESLPPARLWSGCFPGVYSRGCHLRSDSRSENRSPYRLLLLLRRFRQGWFRRRRFLLCLLQGRDSPAVRHVHGLPVTQPVAPVASLPEFAAVRAFVSAAAPAIVSDGNLVPYVECFTFFLFLATKVMNCSI